MIQNLLTRILHQSSTTTVQRHALSGFHSVEVLDIVSTMPARFSVAKASHDAPLNGLATRTGAICGLMLLADDHSVRPPEAQATLIKPPASTLPARAETDHVQKQTVGQFSFMVSIAGNAVGFASLMAGCWFSLQVLQSFL